MRYAIRDTDTGEIIRRHPTKPSSVPTGCELVRIKQPRQPSAYQRAAEVGRQFVEFPF